MGTIVRHGPKGNVAAVTGSDDERVTGRSTGSLARSSAVVAIGTGLSRITGFARTAALAWALGATALAEAYNLANNTPNLLYDLVLGGVLSATLVPVVVDTMTRDDEDGINAIATVITVVLLGATVVGIAAAPLIIWLFNLTAPEGQATSQAAVAVPLLMMFVPQILFYGLTALGTALLNAKRSFAVPAFAPALNNIVVICMLLSVPLVAGRSTITFDEVRHDTGLLLLLGLGTTAGIIAMTLVLIPALRRARISLHWNFAPRHPSVRAIGRLSGWTFGYVVTNLIAYGIIQILANGIGEVTIYAYAWMFFQLPYGMWTVSVMTTYMPELARHHASGQMSELRSRLSSGLRLILVIALPASVGLILLSGPLVRLVFEHGQFSGAAADTTANTVTAFMWGLPGFSLLLYAFRGFYAQLDTRLPFFVNAIESVVAVLIAIALVDRFEVVGLAAANSIAVTAFAVVALWLLHRRVGGFLRHHESIDLAKIIIATAAMGAAVWSLVHLIGGGDVVRVIVGVLCGAIVYGALLFALRIDETQTILRRFRR